MKKIVIMMLLFASTNVLAEWTRLGGTDDSTGYVDIQSIRKNGNKVKMWKLVDYKTAQDRSYLSILVREEYDCLEETKRSLDMYAYSGNMRNGDIVFSNANITEQPKTVLPGSNGEGLLKIACGGK